MACTCMHVTGKALSTYRPLTSPKRSAAERPVYDHDNGGIHGLLGGRVHPRFQRSDDPQRPQCCLIANRVFKMQFEKTSGQAGRWSTPLQRKGLSTARAQLLVCSTPAPVRAVHKRKSCGQGGCAHGRGASHGGERLSGCSAVSATREGAFSPAKPAGFHRGNKPSYFSAVSLGCSAVLATITQAFFTAKPAGFHSGNKRRYCSAVSFGCSAVLATITQAFSTAKPAGFHSGNKRRHFSEISAMCASVAAHMGAISHRTSGVNP